MTNDNSGTVLERRRSITETRLQRVRKHLIASGTESLLGNMACIYATGSIGRGEASEHSDLDVFLISSGGTQMRPDDSDAVIERLTAAAVAADFPPFSKGGKYLEAHPLNDLIGHLGTQEDDHTNVLTARLLLLLESRAVLGEIVYDRAIESVVATYWRDFPGNEKNFAPVFLTNDITRYWKILCVGYESHGNDTVEERRLRNYKLKNSRLLTCYSAILYLAWVLRARETVTPGDAIAMARLTPTQRLEFIRNDGVHAPQARRLLEMYAAFLEAVDADEKELVERFADDKYHETRRAEAVAFGDAIFLLLIQLAGDSKLLRYLLV